MEGHRRDVTCIAVDDEIIVTGGKDRILCFWRTSDGKVIRRFVDAHDRLITHIKAKGNLIATSSRDRSVKIWRYVPHENDIYSVVTLIGSDQRHSVWSIDFNHKYLVSGSADNKIRVWPRFTDDECLFHPDFCLGEATNSVRGVHLIRTTEDALLTSNVRGDLVLYDIKERKAAQEVELSGDNEKGMFHHPGGFISIDECNFDTLGIIAVAFANLNVSLFLSHKE